MWLAIGGWIVKFLGGILPTGQKPFGEWIGKILYFVLLFTLCTGFLNFLFPQKPQKIEVQGDYIAQPKDDVIGVGCNFMRIYVKAGMKK
jgi:hypothetical protein